MRVLFVEDSDFYLHFRRGFLTRIGCQILNARNATQALETIAEEKPDLVVVSSRLPDASGADLCRRLVRELAGHAPRRILVSDAGEPDPGDRAWDDRVVRPIDPEDLMSRISKILRVPQRISPRLAVQLEVAYSSSRERERLNGVCQNLSENGMLIEADAPLATGIRLDLQFTLPGEPQPAYVSAEVIRHVRLAGGHRHRFGVRFLDLDPSLKEKIRGFIASLPKTRSRQDV